MDYRLIPGLMDMDSALPPELISVKDQFEDWYEFRTNSRVGTDLGSVQGSV